MKVKLFFLIFIWILQSCHVPVKRDYGGLSGSLVFNQNKKWLINNIYSDLNSHEKDRLNSKILETFQNLSKGNVFTVEKATKENLLPSKISFNPDLEQLESLKTNSDFDYLVNIRTKKLKDQVASIELNEPFQYSKNEAFAILEIYDLKNLKKVYSQKVSSETSLEGKNSNFGFPDNQVQGEKKSEGPFFSYSADALSVKNLKKILKDIEKKAIK